MSGETTPINEGLSGLMERIGDSAGRVRDLRTQLANELAIRDKLVIEAYDHAGHKQRDIAAAAGITIPSITRILSTSSEDDD